MSWKNLLVLRTFASTSMREHCQMLCVDYFEGKDVDLTEVRDWLSQYEGGTVKLNKNESLGVAEIVLDHPKKRNAITGSMMVQLSDVVDSLEKWQDGKAILMRGEGSIFCSGGDLDFARASAGAEGGFKMACFMHSVLNRLKALPMVSVAVIHGQGALGGGAEISTACDWRLVTRDCRGIGFVHTHMGIVPAWGGSSRLAAIVGSRTALDMITSGTIFSPEECMKVGLVDAIVDPGLEGRGQDAASTWLSMRIRADSQVVRAAKVTMTSYDHYIGCTKVFEEERRIFAPLWGGLANQRALNSHIKHLK